MRNLIIIAILMLSACQSNIQQDPLQPTTKIIKSWEKYQSRINSNENPRIGKVTKWVNGDSADLEFYFTKEMRRVPGELIKYTISNNIKCVWSWSDSRHLNCNIENGTGLKVATKYLLVFIDGLLSAEGEKLLQYKYSFETDRPSINRIGVEWKTPTDPEIEAEFNMGVSLDSLENRIYLRENPSKKISLKAYKIENNEEEVDADWWKKGSKWLLKPTEKLSKNTEYTLEYWRGVATPFGKLVSQNSWSEREYKLQSFDDFKYKFYNCHSASYCNPGEYIRLEFSSPVSKKSVEFCKKPLEKLGITIVNRYRESKTINVIANFSRETKRLKCLENMVDIFGRKLAKETEITITTFDFKPAIFLNYPNELVTKDDFLRLEVETVNTDEISIKLLEKDYSPISLNSKNKSRKTILKKSKNRYQTTNLVEAEKNSLAGILKIGAEPWQHRKFSVQRSNYNAILQVFGQESLILLTDIKDNKPVVNMKFKMEFFYQKENKTERMMKLKATTNSKGISVIKMEVPDFEKFLNSYLTITLETGEKFIVRDVNQIDASVQDEEYSYREDGEEYFWGVTDKPLYRPGETVKYTGLLRRIDAEKLIQTSLPEDSIIYSFLVNDDCYGNECNHFYLERGLELDEYGKISGEFKLPTSATDGRYSITLDNEKFDDNYTNEIYFEVANFKRQKVKVTTSSKKNKIVGNSKLEIVTKAEYYSGGPYRDAEAEISMSIVEEMFANKFQKHKHYKFDANSGDENDYEQSSYYFNAPKLDAHGVSKVLLKQPETHTLFGTLRIISSVLTDEGEKIYSSLKKIPFSKKQYYVGIKRIDWWLGIDKPLIIESRVVDLKGFERKKIGVKYFVQKVDDIYNRYQEESSYKKEEIRCEKVIRATSECTFSHSTPGFHQLIAEIVYPDKTRQFSKTYHYFYDEQNNKTSDIILKKSSGNVEIGKQAKLKLFQSDDNATALITIHRSGLLDYWWQPLTKGMNQISFEVKKNYAPGFDVSIFLNYGNLEQLKQTENPNYAKFISQQFKVEPIKKPPIVEINPINDNLSPKQVFNVELTNKTKKDSSVVLLLVDESIIDQLEDSEYFKLGSSDIGANELSWKAPRQYELANILYSSNQKESQYYGDRYYGGGGERIVVTGSRIHRVDLEVYDRGSVATILSRSKFNSFGSFRANNLDTKTIGSTSSNFSNIRSLFKDAAYWKNDIVVEGNSSETIEIKLPDNLTTWKVIAISTIKSGEIFVDEQKITVSKDLEVHADLPAQLTKGDVFKFKAEVISKSKAIKSIKFSSSAQSLPDKILLSEETKTFSKIIPFERNNLSFNVELKEEGQLEVLTVATSNSITDAVLKTTPIYPTSLIKNVSYHSILPEENKITIDSPTNSVSDYGKLSFKLSGSLISNLQGTFDYMQAYPHQCWEQKLSRAVVAKINLETENRNEKQTKQLATQIQDAVDSIYSFQAANGGMSFFGKNNNSVSPYLSAYSYKMILTLKSKGIDFPKTSTDALQKYLIKLLKSTDSTMTLELASIIINALAMEKRNDEIIKQYLPTLLDAFYNLDVFSQSQILEVASKYQSYKELTQNISETIISQTRYTAKKRVFASTPSLPWYFHNYDAKKYCATISSLAAIHANKKTVYQLVNGLLELRRNDKGDFGNTMSNAYCSVAISDYVSEYESDNSQSKYKLQHGDELFFLINKQKSKSFNVKVNKPIEINIETIKSGVGYLMTTLQYRFDGMKTPVVANGFSINRVYLVKKGNNWTKLSPTNVKQGDYIKVQLRINNPLLRRLVAITDTLPGTFFALDERLATSAPTQLFEELSNNFYFREKQFTKRNVKFYADILPAGNHIIEYLVRVTHQGKFSALSAKIEDMYDDDVFATSTSEVVEVH